MVPPKRLLLIAAEDTEAAANACQWAVDKVYRDGDEFQVARGTAGLPRGGLGCGLIAELY